MCEISQVDSQTRQQFWAIVKNQLEYGTNARVREIEALHGPFQFDDQLVNDGVARSVVGPLALENGATYYGHWYAL